MLYIFDHHKVVFKGGGCHILCDYGSERAPVGYFVDLSVLHFGDERTDHFSMDFAGGDTAAALSGRVDLCVDYEAAAFLLESFQLVRVYEY